jgi:hypothetical protein
MNSISANQTGKPATAEIELRSMIVGSPNGTARSALALVDWVPNRAPGSSEITHLLPPFAGPLVA